MAAHLVLVRHGETEWSKTGQHTSFTDLPLLPEGEEAAVRAGTRLADWHFTTVFTSPRRRAHHTAELALPGAELTVRAELQEWSYGDYEGITTPVIRETNPNWNLWTDGGPNGESPDDVTKRCDAFLAEVQGIDGDVVAFAHSHILRCIASRWVGEPVTFGRHLLVDTASMSVLSVDRGTPVLERWNVR